MQSLIEIAQVVWVSLFGRQVVTKLMGIRVLPTQVVFYIFEIYIMKLKYLIVMRELTVYRATRYGVLEKMTFMYHLPVWVI